MTDVEQLITDNLDIWSSAVKAKSSAGRGTGKKIELYGIKKLRELILELAVRGLLVQQDPNDEPAIDLLKHIKLERLSLVSDGTVKKAKFLDAIHEEEKPVDLPMGWSVERLGNLFDIVYGKGLANSELTAEGYEVFGANGIIGRYSIYHYELPQLLISCRGAYSGKPNISPPYCYITSNTLILRNSWNYLCLKYFFYALTIADKDVIVTGSAQPQVTTKNIDPFVVTVPPLAEQHRIVAKVDELMALCDQLEQQQESSISAHQTLVQTLLGALTNGSDREGFTAAWTRIAEHFDTLFTTEWSIDQLKQTIVQLAVMGKLVPQNPDDEPASELLKKIAAEKAKLIKEGKIKKQKPLPPISEEEKPFELPEGWEWVRFGDITKIVTSGSRGWKEYYSETGSIFIRSQDIKKDYLEYDTPAFVSLPESAEGIRTRVEDNDLLMTITGANVGKVALVHDAPSDAYVSQHVALIRLVDDVLGQYLHKWLTGELGGRGVLLESSYGAKPGLNLQNIQELILPIPPLNEQRRIVDMVNGLMVFSDALISCIKIVRITQLHLADAVADHALA